MAEGGGAEGGGGGAGERRRRRRPMTPAEVFGLFEGMLQDERDIIRRRRERMEGILLPDGTRRTPEELARIRANRAEAQRRVLERAGELAPAEMAPGWRLALATEFHKPYFVRLMAFVEKEREDYIVFPLRGEVFTWAKLCDIQEVKVVLLGFEASSCPRDQGLAFSCRRPEEPSPSLKTIYRELAASVRGFVPPTHGDLTGWARQGVLLLNEVLTVREHQAGSHVGQGWEEFTSAVLACLNRERYDVVFILWGPRACHKGRNLCQDRHVVFEVAPRGEPNAFVGSGIFLRANGMLECFGKAPIDWGAL